MTKRIKTKYLSRYDWLKLRRESIGGSDVATILGFNQYKSAYQLWLDKTGQIDIDTDDPSEAAYWGTTLEEVVASEFSIRAEKRVRNDNHMYFHKEYPFLSANIDRRVVGENAILECKTSSLWLADRWEDEDIPEQYIFQIQHYMNVLDVEYAYVAVLIGGQRFTWKVIERDQELIDIIQERLIDFWENNVKKNVAPPIDGSDATTEFIKERYADYEGGKEVVLGRNEDDLIRNLNEQKETKKIVETNIKELENQLKDKLGQENAEIGITPKNLITWKEIVSNRIDSKRLRSEKPEIYDAYSKESAYRRFAIKEIK